MFDIEKLEQDALNDITEIKTLQDFENARVKLLGRKSSLVALLKSLKEIEPSERPAFGQRVNDLRVKLETLLNDKKIALSKATDAMRLQNEKIDVTMPGRNANVGHKHPISLVIDDVVRIFSNMGYMIAEANDIEHVYYNFDALNIPTNHPARDEQDTFYISDEYMLATQTSPMQIRMMQKYSPPLKLISPGKVYRADEIDATHTPMFHQIEGLVIDKHITFGDLKGTLEVFVRELINENVSVRFRPHHFPFTEPSAEMDVICFGCNGNGCSICKNTGFIELLGCGMVHPKVIANVGLDPEEYSGFAFGMGVERIAMQRYGIDDIRLFYENDIRFLKQF